MRASAFYRQKRQRVDLAIFFLGRVRPDEGTVARVSSELTLSWSGFRVVARSEDGKLWTGELFDDRGGPAAHVFELDVGRSLDNLIGLYDLENRIEFAKFLALEAHKHRH